MSSTHAFPLAGVQDEDTDGEANESLKSELELPLVVPAVVKDWVMFSRPDDKKFPRLFNTPPIFCLREFRSGRKEEGNEAA
jgi:hypothetical protein